jgi:uncharacterized protein YcbK (DUF882 family)
MWAYKKHKRLIQMFTRKFLVLLIILVLGIPAGRTQQDFYQDGWLSLFNTHTNETLTINYLDAEGRIDMTALEQISYVMRSPETNDIKLLDPHLVVELDRIQDYFGKENTLNIICGYRSPAYNEKLRVHSEGVARNSYHLQAKAADISIAGVDMSQIYEYTRALKQGGAGLYSQFVHVDVGPVRFW